MKPVIEDTAWYEAVFPKQRTEESVAREKSFNASGEAQEKQIQQYEDFFNNVFPHIDWNE